LPFATVGALATLMIFGKDLSVYAYVGVIMLIGLVKKNAIMMIDFAIDAEREQHMDPASAIVEAARVRFRPIMMTTMAALMGTFPIALGLGAGGESRQPLGLAVVGGLAFSQLVTLYVTPVVYTYLDRFKARFSRKKARQWGPYLEPLTASVFWELWRLCGSNRRSNSVLTWSSPKAPRSRANWRRSFASHGTITSNAARAVGTSGAVARNTTRYAPLGVVGETAI
jgi:predicted RND superfamily exporter protein